MKTPPEKLYKHTQWSSRRQNQHMKINIIYNKDAENKRMKLGENIIQISNEQWKFLRHQIKELKMILEGEQISHGHGLTELTL